MIDWRYAGDARRDRPRLGPGSGSGWSCWWSPGWCCSPHSSSCRSRCGGSAGPRSGTDRSRCARSRCSCRAVAGAQPARHPRRHRPGRLRRRGVVRPRAGDPGAVPAARPARVRPRRRQTTRSGDAPAADLLTGLRGKDVLVVFVESYGRVALEDPACPPGVVATSSTTAPAASGAPASARAAPSSPPPPSARSAGSRTRRSSPGCGSTASSATTTSSPAPRLTLIQPVRPGRLADGRRRPGQQPRLAAGGVLRLRPRLRLAQRRLPRAPVRLPDDARPVHPRRVPPARARAARPAAGDGRDRPDHQPRAVVADAATDRPGRPSATGRSFDGMPEQLPSEADIWPSPDAGAGGVRPRRSSTP